MKLIASKGSKTKAFHYAYCKCAKNIKNSNIIEFNSIDEAEEQGYYQCPICSRIIVKYNEDRVNIDNYLCSHYLKMYIEGGSMYIDNVFSSWKICARPKAMDLMLYHANTENYGELPIKNGHLVHHYHIQKYRGKSDILSMLKYIVSHDKYKVKVLNDFRRLPCHTYKQRLIHDVEMRKYRKLQEVYKRNFILKVKLESDD